MKIIVIGATGVIGSAVADALSGKHEVLRASRKGTPAVDIEDIASVRALFAAVKGVDAVVSCAGDGKFAPLAKLTDEDFAFSVRSKLMGQVNVARLAAESLTDGGSITLTSGVLSQKPVPGSAALSLVNAGLEGFARAVALELPRKLRINVVSPGWVKETLVKLGMDPAPGISAKALAAKYVEIVEGTVQGQTISAVGP
ncbi:MAG: short chain dehydrogenase [Myxococcaceae bacterium]|jgi:NAD(P)-dependent dehydrogenase (short-subunit alcohol dehydrogenase family)|nr:short chain dehydrogenase [Myxococcaceae bacterium]